MRNFYVLLFVLVLSCGNERVVQLPEISNAKITEVLDVSPAYIFYDETKTDSTEFNRKNLISTTNWLVNVDKRLSLKQAMPHIKYLQDKRSNAQMHKNDAARNFFTCNDISIQNLGFIDFTDVKYEFIVDYKKNNANKTVTKKFYPLDELENPISFVTIYIDKNQSFHIYNDSFKVDALHDKIKTLSEKPQFKRIELSISFSNKLSFQDYITFKSHLLELTSDQITISNNETIY